MRGAAHWAAATSASSSWSEESEARCAVRKPRVASSCAVRLVSRTVPLVRSSKAAELVRLLRKRAEAYRTNQLLLLVGDDFKWSQASLN